MDTIVSSALTKLHEIFSSFVPNSDDLKFDLTVDPLSVNYSGIGGVVGVNDDPPGDIQGRCLQAKIYMNITIDDVNRLENEINTLLQTIMSQSRSDLIRLGIRKLKFIGRENNNQLIFLTEYEFLLKPAAEESEIITNVPLNVNFYQP
jgi:hypothetical protein